MQGSIIPGDPLFAPDEWAPFSPCRGESGRRGFSWIGISDFGVVVVKFAVAWVEITRRRNAARDPSTPQTALRMTRRRAQRRRRETPFDSLPARAPLAPLRAPKR